MFKYKCNICNKEFSDENKSNVTKYFKKHLEKEHGIKYEDYIIKTFHGGIKPKCECGCGTELNFISKDSLFGEGHGFKKYCKCSHVGRNRKNVTIKKSNYQWGDKNWVINFYEELYGIETLKKSFIDFVDGGKSAIKISEEYNIDVRTMKSAWVRLGFITEEDLKAKLKKTKGIGGTYRRKKFENSEEICAILFDIIKSKPNKYNIRSLIRYYNKTYTTKILTEPYIVQREMFEIYGEKIDEYLQFGMHSKEELALLDVLKYFFKKYKITCGKKIYYGNVNKRQYYVYDFCISDKIIIEYDGDGYFHSDENVIKRDKKKEELALKNGYVFMRVSNKETKEIDFLIKLKKLLEND